MATDSKTRALFLCAEAPYPLEGGGALRSASLLNYLALTHDVDLIVFRQPGAPDSASQIPPGLAARIVSIDLPPTSRAAPARLLRNATRIVRGIPPLSDRFAGFGDAVRDAVAGRRYEIGIVEHIWCAPYFEQLDPVCRRTVLDLHNIESVLHARCALAERGAAAFAHGVFLHAAAAVERRWLPRYSRVLVTSDADAKSARALAPDARIEVYPNALPLAPPPPRRDDHAVVFSGNLEYHPNASAVRYFKAEVWPRLRAGWPDLVWRLVGKNPEAIARFVSGDPRIQVIGPVKDAVAELAKSQIAVVPLLAGSGTRFKILEAWAAGTPVVSTSLGAEGLPVCHGENALLADGGSAFAETVSELLASSELRRRLASAGRRLLETDFTWESAWKRLDFLQE
jgi:glycosyltransferase involved in cell wall biosynthesis